MPIPWIPMTPDGSEDTDLEEHWREQVENNENENDDDGSEDDE